jgi:hypothetical protein
MTPPSTSQMAPVTQLALSKAERQFFYEFESALSGGSCKTSQAIFHFIILKIK